jgi:hypothetical protein
MKKPRALYYWILAGFILCSSLYLTQLTASQVTSGTSAVSVQVSEASKFTLASAEQGREVLGRIDEYIRNQSTWERGARMNKVAEISAEDYAGFCRKSVLDWDRAETPATLSAMNSLAGMLKPYVQWMPPEVLIVKTSGDEEYGSAYTRGSAIVIESRGGFGRASTGLLAHELWHVISRHQPKLRDRMFEAIGFHYCGPVKWIAPLDRLRITNPDSPLNQHAIKVKYQGREYMAMPIMYAKTERFGIDLNNNLGAFLDTHLLLVKPDASGTGVEAIIKDGKPLLVTFSDVQNFREQVGYNTNYLDQPEEIMADNFALLVLGRTPRSPEITAKLKAILTTQNLEKAR